MNTTKAEIPGYSNYLMRSDGKVWSKHFGKYMTEATKDKGFYRSPMVYLSDDKSPNIVRRKYVVDLLALAFIPRPEGGLFIKFKDGIYDNFELDNLEWVDNRYDSLNEADQATTTPLGCCPRNSLDPQIKKLYARLKREDEENKFAVKQRNREMLRDRPKPATATASKGKMTPEQATKYADMCLVNSIKRRKPKIDKGLRDRLFKKADLAARKNSTPSPTASKKHVDEMRAVRIPDWVTTARSRKGLHNKQG